ncbi:MAG: hypothetical protein WC533_02645 [Candidatus Pacearchaeota archaeon]
MKKRGVIVACLILILSAGAFAEVLSDNSVSSEVKNYIGSFMEKGGIAKDKVKTINQIDQSNLPDDVEIKEIENNQVGIYQVNYTDEQEEKSLFVITYSADEFKKKQTIVKNIQQLYFGYSGTSEESLYLKTSAGVTSGENKGYVMLSKGSITGISTSLDIISGDGKIEIKVYKNGEDTGFSNTFYSSDSANIDYDLQSENIVTFNAGDVISVYLEKTGGMVFGDATTIVETTSS